MSQARDTESGLHYNWHRYYDPRIGRYITPDPIGLYGGMNVYWYVYGNPINDVDLSGKIEGNIFKKSRWAPKIKENKKYFGPDFYEFTYNTCENIDNICHHEIFKYIPGEINFEIDNDWLNWENLDDLELKLEYKITF